jgi:NADH-quinone oxidoreductase subunit A
MTELVVLLLIFIGTGFGFLAVNLLLGRLLRPHRPDPEKGTIYECGEPTIGSSWIQFDLRFYVVALLFVIFDVEMAFFFPWATVFGNSNKLAQDNLTTQ